MDNNIIDLDEPPTFRREEWIGQNKAYSRKDLPYFVIDACTKALAIPSREMTKFPAQNISVTDLLKKFLPPRSSALITSKPSTWFSKEKPHSNLDCLVDRPIPSDDFLDKLNDDTGQAWLDGAQSIIDQRFNDGRDRLPLFAVTYWREMSRVVRARTAWMKCERWLGVTPDPRIQNEDMTQVFDDARAFLPGLGWDTPVSALDTRLSTMEFTKLLGSEWISTSLVQMMVDNLCTRVRADPQVASSTIIGGPGFAQTLDHAFLDKKIYSRTTTPLLCRYEQHIKDTNMEHFYFPAHVNTNHWITVYTNFKKQEFSYGECLCHLRLT